MRFALISFVLLFVTAGTFAQTPSAETTPERVAADPSKRFSYPYYLYVTAELRTPAARTGKHTILVLPNNTGKLSDDFSIHEDDVKKRMAQVPAIASLLKVAVLMPAFPRPATDWQIYTHALDRDSMITKKAEYRRLDLQLVAMIDDARDRLSRDGLHFDRRVLLNGFSASGMFVNRFTFLHPDRVKAAVIGSPGGWPIVPVKEYKEKALRYPIGVNEFKAVSGRKLNLRELRKVPLLLFMGDKDDNDSVPFGDSYDDEDRDLINPIFGKTPVERWDIARTLYKQAGLNAEFKLYPGVGHTVTLAMRDEIRVFLQKYR